MKLKNTITKTGLAFPKMSEVSLLKVLQFGVELLIFKLWQFLMLFDQDVQYYGNLLYDRKKQFLKRFKQEGIWLYFCTFCLNESTSCLEYYSCERNKRGVDERWGGGGILRNIFW